MPPGRCKACARPNAPTIGTASPPDLNLAPEEWLRPFDEVASQTEAFGRSRNSGSPERTAGPKHSDWIVSGLERSPSRHPDLGGPPRSSIKGAGNGNNLQERGTHRTVPAAPGEALGIMNVVDGAAAGPPVLLAPITPEKAAVQYSVFREGKNGMTVVTLIFPTERMKAVSH